MALVHTLAYVFWHMCIPFLCSSSSILMFVQCSLVCALIFFGISTVEELTQPSKHANKILVSIILAVKATILDIHASMSSQI
jgi:hypothetical protein